MKTASRMQTVRVILLACPDTLGTEKSRGLPELVALATLGKVVEVDPSDLLIDMAGRHAGELVASGRVQPLAASVEALPFPDSSFDKVLCSPWSIYGAISADRSLQSRAS